MPKGKKYKGQKKTKEVLQPSQEKGEQDEGSVTSESTFSEDFEHHTSDSSPEGEEDLFSETDEISDLVDQLIEKNSKTRLNAIAKLKKLFTSKYVGDLLSGNLEFLTDALARGLRKAGGNERQELCRLFMLLAVQVGEEGEVMVASLNPQLLTIAKDPSVRIRERCCCLHAAGLSSYLAISDPKELTLIADEFTPFLSMKEEVASLCKVALTCWSLLLSVCRHPSIISVVKNKVPILLALLESKSLDVKISAGQAAALLFELIPQDCESVDEEWDKTVGKLEDLAGQNSRHVERKERNHQRVSFRDIHQSVESGYVSEQKVSIHHEKVILDSWARIMQYNAIKELLGAGTATHMKENPFLRETFGLPPVHEKQSLEARLSESKEKGCNLQSPILLKKKYFQYPRRFLCMEMAAIQPQGEGTRLTSRDEQEIELIGAEQRDESSGALSSACSGVLYFVSVVLIIMTFPFSLVSIIKIIPEYQRAVIFRLGRLRSAGGIDGEGSGPGMFFVIPCTDDYIPVDLRTRPFDVTPQEILTKDSVTVTVDAVVYFRVEKPLLAVNNALNYEWATRLLAKTTLRNVLGAHSLAEILSEKDSIATQMREILDKGTDMWGVKVERCEIKDVRIPQELQRAMAAEAEASREAKAKVIAAQGELNASRALKEAATVIARSPTALQLRYLQTLNFIGAEKGTSVLFPIPMNLMTGMDTATFSGLQGLIPPKQE